MKRITAMAIAAATGLLSIGSSPSAPTTGPPDFPEGVKTVRLLILCCDTVEGDYEVCNAMTVIVGADKKFFKLGTER